MPPGIQQLHRTQVDLFVGAQGAIQLFAGFGEGRRIEHHRVIASIGRLPGEQVEDIRLTKLHVGDAVGALVLSARQPVRARLNRWLPRARTAPPRAAQSRRSK